MEEQCWDISWCNALLLCFAHPSQPWDTPGGNGAIKTPPTRAKSDSLQTAHGIGMKGERQLWHNPRKGSISTPHRPGISNHANEIWPLHFIHCQSASLLPMLPPRFRSRGSVGAAQSLLHPSQAALIAERLNHHQTERRRFSDIIVKKEGGGSGSASIPAPAARSRDLLQLHMALWVSYGICWGFGAASPPVKSSALITELQRGTGRDNCATGGCDVRRFLPWIRPFVD